MSSEHKNNDSDSARYKADQKQQWDGVAKGWKKWWQKLEKSGQPVSDRLIDLSKIRAGYKVLDIATGLGEPAISIARRVGENGHVTAIDQSSQMIEFAKERATYLGVRNIDFREMDAESMDFQDNKFDAVICRWGLMFLPDVSKALTKIRRLLPSDGMFATSVWDLPANVPFASIPFNIAKEMFNIPPPPPGTPSLFGLADGVLEKRLDDAGFTEIHSEKINLTYEFSSHETFIEYIKDIAAPIIKLLQNQTTEKQNEFWQVFSTEINQFADVDGSIHMPSTTILAVASGQK